MAVELLRSFLEQATASGSRSTVLSELRWGMGILLSALLVALYEAAPFWVLVMLAIILCVLCALYAVAYVYFAIRNPDALRSERFTLSKMAIEKSITGDNLSGLVIPAGPNEKKSLPSTTTTEGK